MEHDHNLIHRIRRGFAHQRHLQTELAALQFAQQETGEHMARTEAEALANLATLDKDVDALIAGGTGTVDFTRVYDATTGLITKVVNATGGGSSQFSVAVGATVNVTPAGGNQGLTFASADPTIAAVASDGTVTGLTVGTTRINFTDNIGNSIGGVTVDVTAIPGPAAKRAR